MRKRSNNERKVILEEEKKERDKELREVLQQKWQEKRERKRDYENNIGKKEKKNRQFFLTFTLLKYKVITNEESHIYILSLRKL
jgi:hypothetical protein